MIENRYCLLYLADLQRIVSMSVGWHLALAARLCKKPVMAEPLGCPRDRMLALLEQYGRETTSFQTLEPGLSYWFDDGATACVAYMDTGGAWVAVGGPIAPPHGEAIAAEKFAQAAHCSGRRVRFFALETSRVSDLADRFALIHIGEQASWDPREWPGILRNKRSLREQLRRARAKGVSVRRVQGAELADPTSRARLGADELVARWKDARSMAPMGFLVHVDLYTAAELRRFFVAERGGIVVGLLSAVPIYARNGWFFEDLLRRPEAPNGTVELLFDHAMRQAACEGSDHVTYGLAPLADSRSRVLCFIRDHTRWLYDFEGLRAFKAKLLPSRWESVYLAYPRGERGIRAVIDILAAFAHGSLLRFAVATLYHRAASVTRLLALLLIPWTLAMALVDTGQWFPSAAAKMGWIGLDIVLFVALMVLASQWRKPLAMALSAAAGGDFILGTIQTVAYNGPRARGPLDWIAIALALLAPLFATGFLWLCRNRANLYRYPPAR
ncbi:MAG: DUF2156 domain-containing protein [Proteobacteria bacterium]|nr:DUF2156 domain-containing protein [Pseudomonadota bacterium]